MKPVSIIKFLFFIWPLAEIAVLIWVGGLIGVGWTLLLIIASSMLGVALMRNHGFKAMREFSQNARMGRAEPSDVFEGSFIFIGGFLLIIPGFITSVIGLLCIIPIIRRAIAKWMILAIAQKNVSTTSRRVIEGKFKEKDTK
jgi:UPF0716 protein FxsA